MKTLAAFPTAGEFEKMRSALSAAGLPYEVVDPSPAYSHVGCPAIVLEQEYRAALAASTSGDYIASGWVEYRRSNEGVPSTSPRIFTEDLFGSASIMVVAPCVADATKIRLVAHLSGDITLAFPFLNAEMRGGCYNRDADLFTFMDAHRMITLYPRRISMAKADDIIDGWRTLEKIRCLVNDVYARRASIEPSYEMRKKPPALEIYKRLPAINCGACGQKTCMAFALTLWGGNAKPSHCTPVMEGDFVHLREAFLEICAGLGVTDPALSFGGE